jgi:hypothetical protein
MSYGASVNWAIFLGFLFDIENLLSYTTSILGPTENYCGNRESASRSPNAGPFERQGKSQFSAHNKQDVNCCHLHGAELCALLPWLD